MEQFLILLFACLLILSCQLEKKILPILSSIVENLHYEINGKLFPNWKISPTLKPDRLKFESGEQGFVVKFISDIDTII